MIQTELDQELFGDDFLDQVERESVGDDGVNGAALLAARVALLSAQMELSKITND